MLEISPHLFGHFLGGSTPTQIKDRRFTILGLALLPHDQGRLPIWWEGLEEWERGGRGGSVFLQKSMKLKIHYKSTSRPVPQAQFFNFNWGTQNLSFWDLDFHGFMMIFRLNFGCQRGRTWAPLVAPLVAPFSNAPFRGDLPMKCPGGHTVSSHPGASKIYLCFFCRQQYKEGVNLPLFLTLFSCNFQ